MMHVIVDNPLEAAPLTRIGRIAGTSTGRRYGYVERAVSCWEKGHMSVFEHVQLSWSIEGISRACSHQLVRHRLASYTQRSQRYSKVPVSVHDDSWHVTPPSLKGDKMFETVMVECAQSYLDAVEGGTPPEDARYMLPEATKTSLVASMNLRELRHFHMLRADSAAQWEIRQLADLMVEAIPWTGEWAMLARMLREDLV